MKEEKMMEKKEKNVRREFSFHREKLEDLKEIFAGKGKRIVVYNLKEHVSNKREMRERRGRVKRWYKMYFSVSRKKRRSKESFLRSSSPDFFSLFSNLFLNLSVPQPLK